jgi:hypothetical protein
MERIEAGASRAGLGARRSLKNVRFRTDSVTRLLAEEALGCDVASAAELAIALAAGFPPAEILLHVNAKSDEDIAAALEAGVGLIVRAGPLGRRPLDRHAYSVVTVKRGHVSHVVVDGRMGDDLEPMLYGQELARRSSTARASRSCATSSGTTARAATSSAGASSSPRLRSATCWSCP